MRWVVRPGSSYVGGQTRRWDLEGERFVGSVSSEVGGAS